MISRIFTALLALIPFGLAASQPPSLSELLERGFEVITVVPGAAVGQFEAFLSGERSLFLCRIIVREGENGPNVNFFDRFDPCLEVSAPKVDRD